MSYTAACQARSQHLLIETLTTAVGLSSLQMLFSLDCLVGNIFVLILISPVFVHARYFGP